MNEKQMSMQPREVVRKPYLKGSAFDENTVKNSFVFLGSLLLVSFMSFIVCTTTSAAGLVIRMIVNVAIIALILYLFYNRASVHGADAVAHGEILYQKEHAGTPVSASEKRISYHPLKAFVCGLLGTMPFFLLVLIFAIISSPQTTGAGALPSWIQAYAGRDEITGPLSSYMQTSSLSFAEVLRVIVRITLMPYISLMGSANKEGVYLVEKISPLLMLLPACAYGLGYLTGPNMRARIHTAISENEQKRVRRERKARKARAAGAQKHTEPEQLN